MYSEESSWCVYHAAEGGMASASHCDLGYQFSEVTGMSVQPCMCCELYELTSWSVQNRFFQAVLQPAAVCSSSPLSFPPCRHSSTAEERRGVKGGVHPLGCMKAGAERHCCCCSSPLKMCSTTKNKAQWLEWEKVACFPARR